MSELFGYTGKLLRIGLTQKKVTVEDLDEDMLRKYVGGATLGIRYLSYEVSPAIGWNHPENILFFGSGPLGGTRISGSGSIAVVTKGTLTNGVTSTQANGFWGAYLRFSGYDGLIVRGSAPDWVYLYVHDGIVEFKNAAHLVGRNIFDTDSLIKEELGKREREVSIACIGPAGENLVKFACISVDKGHMAAHNGVGAVMGSKKLKAIVIERGKNTVLLKDKEALLNLAREIRTNTLSDAFYNQVNTEGTIGGIYRSARFGFMPVKNLTTAVHPFSEDILNQYSSQYIRTKFKAVNNPCWACQSNHCSRLEIIDEKSNIQIVDEPEFEGMGSFSSGVGITDVASTIALASQVDSLGMDVNAAGWVISWTQECFEKGILTPKDTDGLEMKWGNVSAIRSMLNKIAFRQGFGDILAEGVKNAAEKVGGQASLMTVSTLKGNVPRSHDHRSRWLELFDTVISNLGALETQYHAPFKDLGLSDLQYASSRNAFDPAIVSTTEAKIKGAMVFEDSLVTCRFQTATAVELLCKAVNAATGWDMDLAEAMTVGRRTVNMARIFNINHGIGTQLDRPSPRYGSTPTDGIAAGKGILEHWDDMLQNYYRLMGWDNQGRPLPETLKALGL